MVTSTPTHAVDKIHPNGILKKFKKTKKKTVQLLELMESKEYTVDGHDGSNAAAACFITCVDIKDVANHSLDK